MVYIVDVPVSGDLNECMARMRTWLDHLRCNTGSFRQVTHSSLYRIDFFEESDARAFAVAFGGELRCPMRNT